MKTLKKVTVIILSILLILTIISSLGVTTYAEYPYYDIYYSISGGSVTITGCTTTAQNVEIPDKILLNPVTKIGDHAFWNYTLLKSIKLPDTITAIGSTAFFCCTSLSSINIPDSVTSIGNAAFRGCTSLTSITIPDLVTEIETATFSDCTKLENVILPENLTSIGERAFNATQISEIVIPKSVKEIGDQAFYSIDESSVVQILYEGTEAEWNEISIGDNNRIAVTYNYCEHIEETIPGKAATCTATGLTEGIKCSVCGEILKEQEEIPMLTHTEETVSSKAATCTETGLTDGTKCSVCGEVVKAQEVIPAKGHSFGEWIVENEATILAEGVEKRVCSECGETETRSTPKLDYLKGDLNKDSKITAADARLALRISAKLEPATDEMTVIADVNDDKKITAADARMILRVSAKLDSF